MRQKDPSKSFGMAACFGSLFRKKNFGFGKGKITVGRSRIIRGTSKKSRSSKARDSQNQVVSKSYGGSDNFVKIADLRKKIISFREFVELPPCISSSSIIELVKDTVKELHKLHPDVVRCISVSGSEGTMHKAINELCVAIKSLGKHWTLNDEWMVKSIKDDKASGDLEIRVLALLDDIICVARERMFNMRNMDDDDDDDDKEMKGVNSRSSSYGKSSTRSYSDKVRFSSSSTSPTSVLQEFPNNKSAKMYPRITKEFVKSVDQMNKDRNANDEAKNRDADCDGLVGVQMEIAVPPSSLTSIVDADNVELNLEEESSSSSLERLSISAAILSPPPQSSEDVLPLEMASSLRAASSTRMIENILPAPPPPPPLFDGKRNIAALVQTPPPPQMTSDTSAAPAPPPPPPPPPVSSMTIDKATPLPLTTTNIASPALPPPPPPPPPPPMVSCNSTILAPGPPHPPPAPMALGSMPPPPPPLPPSSVISSDGSVPAPLPYMTSGNTMHVALGPSSLPASEALESIPPPSMVSSDGSVLASLRPVKQDKGGAPPPPPVVGGGGKLLRKSVSKLRRSSQMGCLYRQLRAKVEGSSFKAKSLQRKGSKVGVSVGNGKQGMADALAEITKRSSYFQQIEEDVKNYSNSIEEVKAAIISFQTTDMDELIEFHNYVESHLEKLTDETQVLARFDNFPSKKLEGLRMAAALYSKLDAIATTLQNWKIVPPVNQLLDRVENYFNKIKGELDTLDRTKEDEIKKFKSQKIHFDFGVLIKIKELMVDVSSSCMELALKEKRETSASKKNGKKINSGRILWKAFEFAFRVYSFAGGQDDRADNLTKELAQQIQAETLQ